MCQKKRETWSQHMLGFLLAKKQNVQMWLHTNSHTCWYMCVLTHGLKFESQCKPGNTVVLKAKHWAYVKIWCDHNSRMVQYCVIQCDAGGEAKWQEIIKQMSFPSQKPYVWITKGKIKPICFSVTYLYW